ncbi:MAG: hypothetical protein WCW31_03735 [Patescibacteria group bacterium]
MQPKLPSVPLSAPDAPAEPAVPDVPAAPASPLAPDVPAEPAAPQVPASQTSSVVSTPHAATRTDERTRAIAIVVLELNIGNLRNVVEFVVEYCVVG